MTTETGTTETEETEVEETEEEEEVRDAEAVLKANRKLAEENRKLRHRQTETDSELERLRKLEESSKTDREKELDQIRKDAVAEVETKYRTLLLSERVQARAARRFQDPEDVVRLLDLDDIDSPEAIDAALDDLATSKPYLLLDDDQKENGRRKVPDADQGSRGRPPGGQKKQSPDDWLLGLSGR